MKETLLHLHITVQLLDSLMLVYINIGWIDKIDQEWPKKAKSVKTPFVLPLDRSVANGEPGTKSFHHIERPVNGIDRSLLSKQMNLYHNTTLSYSF